MSRVRVALLVFCALGTLAILGALWWPRTREFESRGEFWEETRYGAFGYAPTTAKCVGMFGSFRMTAEGKMKDPFPPPKVTPHPEGMLLTIGVTVLVLALDALLLLLPPPRLPSTRPPPLC